MTNLQKQDPQYTTTVTPNIDNIFLFIRIPDDD